MAIEKLTSRKGLEKQAEILLAPLSVLSVGLDRLREAVSMLPAEWDGPGQYNVNLIRSCLSRADGLQGEITALIKKLE